MINKNFGSLDFFEVKKSIINHFKNSTHFKDYDFTGSRLNTLIDGLAYAALYQGTFANAALFESFLQTARNRGSVVLAAQDLGYIPASMMGSSTDINLTLEYTQPTNKPLSVRVPFGFKFFGNLGDSTFEFVTFQDSILTLSASGQYSGYVPVVQGKIVRQQYIWETSTRIFIKDPTIDRRHIRIHVNGTEYRPADNAARVAQTDAVFYFRETIDGWTEIYFGTGELEIGPDQAPLSNYVGGLRPSVGQPVTIEFLSVKGAEANGVTDFKAVDSIPNFQITVPTGVNPASGGGDRESIERIRSVAPRVFEAQGRCVTATDYETKVLEEFGAVVDAIRCWGDRTKPGYAFIAIKPAGGLSINRAQADMIEDYLKKYNVLTISPKVVTPDYLFIEHQIDVDYKATELDTSEDELYNSILRSVETYYTSNVTTFSSSYHTSKLLTQIDSTSPSILGSACHIRLVKEHEDNYATTTQGLSYLNPVAPGSLRSSSIKYLIESPIDIELIGSGDKILVGPFPPGSGSTQGISATDIPGAREGGDYYQVGTIDNDSGAFSYNLGATGIPRDMFQVGMLKIYAVPEESDIYTSEGSLIVYEPLLRPEYVNLTLQTIM